MKIDILKALNTERAARRATVVVTDVASGGQRLVKAADVAREHGFSDVSHTIEIFGVCGDCSPD